ncbi:DMT family transporter [Mongoliibacter ruber]|uniref:EamA domain-containing membrane protein RarD n=1 Tax=Mongoliibacter ruber TaxID=1750599 RepID=A0A2T0WQK4_9BACT|nr:DMT family transporter [Mongoliibacter ruber]PRY88970.1 EamA domain-containing membrane protein RarD [Mongoliibacter ruber]
MSTEASVKDYLLLHFIVLIWGFTAILGLLISIPSLEVVFYRTLIASLLLGFLFLVKKKSIRVSRSELIKIIGTGFIISLHWILFFWAARVSTASVCLAGMATTSLWTAFVEPLANRSKVKPFEIFLGLMVISGLYVIFRFELNYWLGLLMAVGSAFLSAVFTVINGRLTKRHSPYILTLYEMMGACLFAVILMPIYAIFFAENGLNLMPVGLDWLWLFLLGGVCTVYAFSVSVELMRRITAFAVNLTINLEPVYGIVLAVLIFGDKEQMSGGFYIGTLIILISVLIYPVYNYYQRRKAKGNNLLRA